jgi:superfamily II DNA or RNA helicase
LKTGFHIENAEVVKPFYGFSLTGDGRYLLADFTVTHNTGKTIVFAHFPEVFQQKMLVIAHREELLNQARDKILQANPNLWVEIEQADRKASPMCDVVIASVATIGRAGSERLKKFDPDDFPIIVVDEAHHIVASSYMNVLEYFGVFNGSDKLLVGWTATPNRGDNVALNRVFQKIVYQKNLREMIEAGWLSPIRAYRVETESDLSNVHVRQGDFVSGELSFYLDENERNRLVVSSYLAYARGRKALVYAIDVEHAHHLAECFTAANIPAAAVSGKTPQDERHAMLEAFAAGDIQVLANCMILSEGYDQPDVGAIIMARPTMSGLLYAQQVGRGTRLAPGKEDVVVIDLVDNSKRHPLVTMPTLFGLSPEFNTQGKLLIDEVKRMEDLIEEYPHIPIDKATSIEDAQRLLREFDILGRAREVDEELVPYTPFVWASPSKDVYTMRMQNRDILTIQKNLLDQWEFRVTGHDPEAPWRVVARETVATSENKQDVFNEANGMIGEWYGNEEVLHARDARWKKDAATPKQVALLDKNRIPHPPNISKGEAGLLLDYHFSSRKRKT